MRKIRQNKIKKSETSATHNVVNKTVLMLILSVFLVAGTILYVVESSSLGSRLAKVEKKESELRQENRDLSDQLVNFDSLTNIAAKQDELSFIKPSKVIYMKAEENVAKAF